MNMKTGKHNIIANEVEKVKDYGSYSVYVFE